MERQDIIEAMRGWMETIAIVPPEFAEYGPLVIDGLLHFLSRLTQARLDAIVTGQLELADDSTADDRLIALLRQCPTLHKLGQVIARQSGLPLALRTRLQALESLTSEPGGYAVAELIERELGQLPGLTVAPDALAEGSVAFVVPFEWRDGAAAPRRGVFKALKPRAEQDLLEDLAIWPELADFLAAEGQRFGLAGVDFHSLLDGVARLLRNEIRLDGEQQQLVRARRFYADSPDIVIPALFDFCTPRLTAMERIDGVKVTDPSLAPATRRRIAKSIVTALLAKPFWSAPAAEPFFHADPHAGNLFATTDGKLAIFDWALTTELGDAQLAAVVHTLLSAAVLDESGVVRALAALGDVKQPAELQPMVAAALGDVRRGTFPGFGWLTPLLDRLARSGALAFPEETALFRKSLLTLSGVVRDVWPAASIDEVLVASGGRQFLCETPLRPFAAFESRAFGTHVSNDDLLRFMSSLTLTPARYMLGAYGEVLEVLSR